MREALATLSSVASSASSVPLVSANPARKGLTIQNSSTAILYLRNGRRYGDGHHGPFDPDGQQFELSFAVRLLRRDFRHMGNGQWVGQSDGV